MKHARRVIPRPAKS